MRDLMRDAVKGAVAQMRAAHEEMRTPLKMTDQQVVERYVKQHRGNEEAMRAFVARMTHAEGPELTRKMLQYEIRMERMLKKGG